MEEKAQQIKEYLSTLGFKIPDFYSIYQTAGSKFNVDYSISFGDELMNYQLKFSWDHQFDNYRLDGYKATYRNENGRERSQYFSASYVGIAHANLVYNVLSGRLEDIREKLLATGIEEFTADDFNAFLERTLCQIPETFTYHASKRDKEGLIDFDIDMALEGNFYEASDINTTFVRYPKMEHGVFNGIDTQELAAAMVAIDWDRDDLYFFNEHEEPVLSPEVEGLFYQVMKLSDDEMGRSVALNLQLRHWSEVPYFEAFVQDGAWEMYHSQPKTVFNFPLDTDAHKIYNLMCGRSAIAPRLTDVEHDTNLWDQLSTESGVPLLIAIEGPSRYEIETFLTMLPVDDMDKDRMLTRLLRGDICTTTLYGLEPTRVNIAVDLPTKALKIETLDGQAIPYNFRLAPEPQQPAAPVIQPGKWEHRQPKKNKKRKGRGI